jgi:hypothetical protein
VTRVFRGIGAIESPYIVMDSLARRGVFLIA